MDPNPIGPAHWDQVSRSLTHLALFLGLTVNSAFSFLLAHGVIPSLVSSGDAPPEAQVFRRVLYPISALSLLLMLLSLGRAISLAVPTLQQIYPRFAI